MLAIGGILLLAGCAGGGAGGGGGGGGQRNNNGPGFPNPTAFGKLAGQVVDVAGRPLVAARVSVGTTRSASTDENGFFSFDGLAPGATVVKVARSGFAASAKRIQVSEGAAAVECIMLADAGPAQMIDPQATARLQAADSMVTINPGTLTTSDGRVVAEPVQVVVSKIDPSTPAVMTFPGAFTEATNAAGARVQLESFGFATYELSCNGQSVDLAAGQTATIEYILPANSQDRYQIGDVVPRWEFDDDSATWLERGSGTIQLASDGSGRKAWIANVEHFSSWNCDAPIEQKNCLAGMVVDDTGGPVAGATVTAVGLSYNGTSSDMTDSSGRFCVDVKRGAMVRLELRVNGSAAALATRTVSVPDSSASCGTGGCMEITPPLSVAFNSCVRGRVTDNNGNAVGNETVYVVPGQTVQTDANGNYCARAPADLDVFVFALGRESVMVHTPSSGTCPSGCAQADITISLPTNGDQVGVAYAQKLTTIGSNLPGGQFQNFVLGGSFFALDASRQDFTVPGQTRRTETIGGCTVTTTTFTFTFDPNNPSATSFTPQGFAPLDPGNPGVADNGTVTINLLRGNPAQTDPPQPFLAGVFSPDPAAGDLLARGLDSGQTIRFSWPGGADIGAFADSIGVPAEITVLSPDLRDPNLTISTGSDLNVRWTAGNSSDRVLVLLSASQSSSQTNPDGTFTTNSMSVSIDCESADNGSGTVPAQALSRLPGPVQFISVHRQRTKNVPVSLLRTGGQGTVLFLGSTSLSHSFATPTP
jgi:hypothetical protein